MLSSYEQLAAYLHFSSFLRSGVWGEDFLSSLAARSSFGISPISHVNLEMMVRGPDLGFPVWMPDFPNCGRLVLSSWFHLISPGISIFSIWMGFPGFLLLPPKCLADAWFWATYRNHQNLSVTCTIVPHNTQISKFDRKTRQGIRGISRFPRPILESHFSVIPIELVLFGSGHGNIQPTFGLAQSLSVTNTMWPHNTQIYKFDRK